METTHCNTDPPILNLIRTHRKNMDMQAGIRSEKSSGLFLSAFAEGPPAEVNTESALEQIHQLLSEGLLSQAQERIASQLRLRNLSPAAEARLLYASSRLLELRGKYRESLQVIRCYEQTSDCAALDAETRLLINRQLGIVYGLTGNSEHALAILREALREEIGRAHV